MMQKRAPEHVETVARPPVTDIMDALQPVRQNDRFLLLPSRGRHGEVAAQQTCALHPRPARQPHEKLVETALLDFVFCGNGRELAGDPCRVDIARSQPVTRGAQTNLSDDAGIDGHFHLRETLQRGPRIKVGPMPSDGPRHS